MKNPIFFLLFLLAFVSCSKDDTVLESSVDNLPKYIIGEYSSNGTIVKDTVVIHYKGNKIDYTLSSDVKTVYEYQANTLTIKNYFTENAVPRFYTVYDYNALGKLTKHTTYEHATTDFNSPTYKPEFTYLYKYNTDGTVEINGYYTNQTTISEYFINTFDLNGNIVQNKRYLLNNDSLILDSKTDFTYDNQSHYFKNTLIPNTFISNVNNVTKEVTIKYSYFSNNTIFSTDTYNTDYQIQYNAAGFPISINNGGAIRRFVY